MEDLLHVAYEKSEKDLSALVITRRKDKYEMLVARLGEDADKIYRILTEQGLKFKIIIDN